MDFEFLLFRIKRRLKKFWKKTKKFFKRAFKKIRRWFKKYLRMLVRHTKAGDYSILTYTILALIALILMIVLLCNLGNAGKSDKKKKDNKNNVATASDIIIEDSTVAPTTIIHQQPANPATMTDAGFGSVLSEEEQISKAKEIYGMDEQYLKLVNTSSPLPADYTFNHHTLSSGHDVDERCYDALNQMLTECNNNGLYYSIVSAYRSREYQQTLIDNDISSYMNSGMSYDEAYAKTVNAVQLPGCSEHETGLALDITAEGYYVLDESQYDYPTIQWLDEHCYEYGFILRYPKDKEGITQITYEPWHFRYVGINAALFMRDNNLCLEEFHELLNK